MRFLSATSRSFARFTSGFSIPLARQGLVLVEGINRDPGDAFTANAVGKSMLFEGALSWCPYGKLARYGNDRIGSTEVCFDGQSADVGIEFETGPRRFRAHRRRTAKGAPTLVITVQRDDGSWVSLREAGITMADATEDLTAIIGFDFLTMRSAMFLQGSGMDMGASTFGAQMKILESVLRFDIFSAAKKDASSRFSALELEARSLIEEMTGWSHAVESATDALRELEALDESEREAEITQELAEIETGLLAFEDLDDEHADALTYQQNSAKALLDARVAIGTLRERVHRLGALTDTCPTCEQEVSREVISGYELARADLALDEVGLAACEGDAFSAQRRLDEMVKRKTERDTLLRDQTQRERELRDLRERAARRLPAIQAQETKRRDAEQHVAALTDRIAGARRAIQVAGNWARRDFDNMKGETFAAGAPYFNDRAQHFSNLFTDGAIQVALNTSRESRSEDLLRISGASAPTYKGCSAGEKRRIDIITALSLRALARWRMHGDTVNVALWDEVLDPLDDAGVSRAMQVLQQDMDSIESVFLVTHNPRVREMFPSAKVWRVIRENNRSRVETA